MRELRGEEGNVRRRDKLRWEGGDGGAEGCDDFREGVDGGHFARCRRNARVRCRKERKKASAPSSEDDREAHRLETPAIQRSSSVKVGRKLEIQRSGVRTRQSAAGEAQSAPGLTSRSAERKPGTRLRAFFGGACASVHRSSAFDEPPHAPRAYREPRNLEEKRRRRCEHAGERDHIGSGDRRLNFASFRRIRQ